MAAACFQVAAACSKGREDEKNEKYPLPLVKRASCAFRPADNGKALVFHIMIESPLSVDRKSLICRLKVPYIRIAEVRTFRHQGCASNDPNDAPLKGKRWHLFRRRCASFFRKTPPLRVKGAHLRTSEMIDFMSQYVGKARQRRLTEESQSGFWYWPKGSQRWQSLSQLGRIANYQAT